jgi:urease gamma subunit
VENKRRNLTLSYEEREAEKLLLLSEGELKASQEQERGMKVRFSR